MATTTETINFINDKFARNHIACETHYYNGAFVVLFDHDNEYAWNVLNDIAIRAALCGIDVTESPFPQTIEGMRAEREALMG